MLSMFVYYRNVCLESAENTRTNMNQGTESGATSPSIQVKMLHFAKCREIVGGKSEEKLLLSPGSTIANVVQGR